MSSRETAQIVLEHVVPEKQEISDPESSVEAMNLPFPTVHPKKQNANRANRMEEAALEPVL